jgi:hypothetical protein
VVLEAVEVAPERDGRLDLEMRGDDARVFIDVRLDEDDSMGRRRDVEHEVAADRDVHPESTVTQPDTCRVTAV